MGLSLGLGSAALLYLGFNFLFGGCEKALVPTSKSMLVGIDASLIGYRAMNGEFPSERQGLLALVERPETEPIPRRWSKQFEELPRDSWNNEFRYRFPGSVNPELPEVISAGADGVFGTEDDISSQRL